MRILDHTKWISETSVDKTYKIQRITPTFRPKKTSDINDVVVSANLANLVYDIDQDGVLDKIKEFLPTSSEIVIVTNKLSSDSPEKRHEFQSIAIIDNNTRKITFVTAGTRLNNAMSDIYDDIRLSIGMYPKKVKSFEKLNNIIIQQFGEEISNYKLHYTGHSLGAALSDIGAADMAIKLHKKGLLNKCKISTCTFDNPGGYTLVKHKINRYNKNLVKEEKDIHKLNLDLIKLDYKDKAADKALLKKLSSDEKKRHKEALENIENKKIDLNFLKDNVSYVTINNRPNIINTTDRQVGKCYTIVPLYQKPRNIISRFLFWFSENVSSYILYIPFVKLIAHGRPIYQASEHKMSNFINVLQKKKGYISSDKYGEKLVTIDKIARDHFGDKHITAKKDLNKDIKLIKKEVKGQVGAIQKNISIKIEGARKKHTDTKSLY